MKISSMGLILIYAMLTKTGRLLMRMMLLLKNLNDILSSSMMHLLSN